MPTAEPSTAPPAPEPVVDPAPPAPPRTGLLRATALVATLGVVVALVGVGLLLVPIRTPARECGTSLTYLLDGRVDPFIDPNDLPEGVTAGDAEANNARPCHPRVVDWARPGAQSIALGTVVALVALSTEVLVRNAHRRRRHLGDTPSPT